MLYLNQIDEQIDNVVVDDFIFDGEDNDEVIYLEGEIK